MSHAYTIRNISRHATHIYDGEELIGYMQPSSSRTTGGWNAYYGSTYATTHKLSLYCVAVGYSQEKCLENLSKRMNTIHKFYGKRGAEKLLGIAPYTLDQVAARHPLPSTEFTCDGLPIYTKEQLQDWYEERPRHGGDRKSDAFKKATGNRKE